MGTGSRAGWTPWLPAALALAAGAAAGEPLDLRDLRPRLVSVRFELSPADRPGQLDSVWSVPFAGWLEPVQGTSEVRIRIDGGVVERHLLRDYDPMPGSFSDFVWRIDTATGHVRQASVAGRLARHLRLGPRSWRVDADIRVQMDTAAPVGFAPPQDLFGQSLAEFCRDAARRGCTLVAPQPYDPRTGYVRALGPIAVAAPLLHVESFSPLGEALFHEVADPGELEGLSDWRDAHAAPLPGGIGLLP
jgi:hypothetical protein